MGIDEKIRRAAVDARAAVAARRGEPITVVRRRFVFQRIVAFGLGAVVVLAGVGLVALTGRGSGTALVPPAGDTTTSTTAPATTTSAVSTTAAATTTTSQVTTTTEPIGVGDGLSDVDLLPDGLVDEGDTLLLAERGLGIVSFPAIDLQGVEHPGEWDFAFWDDGDVSLGFGTDYVIGETLELSIQLSIREDSPTVTVFGVAPSGVTEIDLRVMSLGEAAGLDGSSGQDATVRITEFYERPEVDRSVFVGSFDLSLLTQTQPPVVLEPWVVAPVQSESVLDMLDLSTFGFQGIGMVLSYEGPISADLFIPPQELALVTDSVQVDAFPPVGECQAPAGVEAPPNQVGTTDDGNVYPTPRAAFEAIMDGELSDPGYPHAGYIELTDAKGNVAYAAGFGGDVSAGRALVLVEVQPVDGGWTVTRWEASGC